MNKYYVKNCPAFNGKSEECAIDNGLCEFCTDCLIKQIIEKRKVADRVIYDGDYNEILEKIKDLVKDQEIESIKSTWEGNRKHVSIFLKDVIKELHTYITVE